MDYFPALFHSEASLILAWHHVAALGALALFLLEAGILALFTHYRR